MNDAANPAEHRVDTRSTGVEVDVCASLGRQNGAAQLRPQSKRSNLLEVVIDSARPTQGIDRVGNRLRFPIYHWRWRQRRRLNIAQPVNSEHAINAELRVRGGGTDKGNGGKKENCFAETHVPLVY